MIMGLGGVYWGAGRRESVVRLSRVLPRELRVSMGDVCGASARVHTSSGVGYKNLKENSNYRAGGKLPKKEGHAGADRNRMHSR